MGGDGRLRVILIDDENPALDEMSYILGQYPDVEIVGRYQQAEQALEELPAKKPDAAFVDIGMPSGNGIRLMEKIREQNSRMRIVFVTAYPEYALEAYHVFPLDYIVKPVDEERFSKTMAHLREELSACGEPAVSARTDSRFRIRCFGEFDVYFEEKNGLKQQMKFATRQARALFLYLLTCDGREAAKPELTDVLFKGMEPRKAANLLYVSVHSLRRSLADISAARHDVCIHQKYRLDVPEGVCDYLDFIQFVSQFDSAEFRVDGENIKKAARISRLYTGNLFDRETYDWLEPMRLHAEQGMERLLLSMAQFYFQSHKAHDCEKTLLRLLRVNPFSFEGNSALFDLYMAIGNKGKFKKQYEICAETLKRELGTEPAALYKTYYLSIR